MTRKKHSIPVKEIDNESSNHIFLGIPSIDEINFYKDEEDYSHRHNYHLFVLHEKGKISMDLDFQQQIVNPHSLIYISPNQIHKVKKIENEMVSYILAIDTDYINTEYLTLLEKISPLIPLRLNDNNFEALRHAMLFSIKLFENKGSKLYYSLLKDSSNLIIGMMLAQYLEDLKRVNNFSRFETMTINFKSLLEKEFVKLKRPSDYANKLNVSVSYLTECVKTSTGLSASSLIQQRIILEAKRLLYHSNKSVKEVAAQLGYDDYTYFSRLFKKVVGISPILFKTKNHD